MTWIVPQELLLDAHPGRPVALDPALDHTGFAQRALALAGALQARGTQRVALYLEDGADLAIALFGAWPTAATSGSTASTASTARPCPPPPSTPSTAG